MIIKIKILDKDIYQYIGMDIQKFGRFKKQYPKAVFVIRKYLATLKLENM